MNDDQIVEITRGQLDEICRERDKFKAGYAETCECITAQEGSIDELYEQLIASQARETKLRQALEYFGTLKLSDGTYADKCCVAVAALSIPTADQLRAAQVAILRKAANKIWSIPSIAVIQRMADELSHE